MDQKPTVASVTADLRAEQDALDDIVADLTMEQWATATASPRWTVADQIGHLTFFDSTATEAILEPERFTAGLEQFLGQFAGAGPESSDEVTLGEYRAMTPDQLLGAWRDNRARLCEAAGALGESDRVPWYGPSMGSKSFLTARLMECWAHGQDIVDAVGATRPPSDRLRHIVQLGIITRGWSYMNRGLEQPTEEVRVVLSAPSGATWTFGADDRARIGRGHSPRLLPRGHPAPPCWRYRPHHQWRCCRRLDVEGPSFRWRGNRRTRRRSVRMTEQLVETSLDNGVFTITLTDEAKRNALSVGLSTQFVDAIDAAEADDAVHVVVVTNTGRTFCAGADLSERSGDAPPNRTGLNKPAGLYERIRNSPKPFVGKIAGHAVAGGLGLAASMDISVGLVDAKFGFTEVRIGVAPAMISVICIPKMGAAAATEEFLRGNRFGGDRAAELGLINYAVAPDELDAKVDEIVDDLREGAPAALAACKQLVQRVPAMGFSDAMSWTAELSADLFQSEGAQEGMRAYLEKRPPTWSPRAAH